MTPIDDAAACPHCGVEIRPRPKRGRDCPHCGRRIAVRSGKLMKEGRAKSGGQPARPRPAKPDVKYHRTNLAGVMHPNRDGSDRQRLISRCRPGEPLILERHPWNYHDRTAVAVFNEGGAQLGFIPSEYSREITADLKGGPYYAAVERVMGGEPDKPNLGLLMLIVVAGPAGTEEEARELFARIWESRVPGRSVPDFGPLRVAGERPPQSSRKPKAAETAPQPSGCLGALVLLAILTASVAGFWGAS